MQNDLYLDPIPAESIKLDQYVMFGENPCKIFEFKAYPCSRHGSGQIIVKGRDVLNDKIIETRFRSYQLVLIPKVQFFEYSLLGIQENNYLILLNQQGQTREDIKLNKEQQKEITQKIIDKFAQGINIIIQTVFVLNIEQVQDFREELD